jgi:hypothetical protein
MGNIAEILTLMAVSAFAWLRRRNIGGKTWAFRIIPLGQILFICDSELTFLLNILILLAVYATVAYLAGWRLSHPANHVLRGMWWSVHILVYFVFAFIVCAVLGGVVCTVVRFSPIATESDWPWTKGKITDQLPFAAEYKRAKTLCAEYDKRLMFKSGKRIGLPIDTCGFGPFQVYRLKSGEYCLVDGFDRKLPESFGDQSRWLRVNVEKETVELKYGIGWFRIPEKGYVRGWGGSEGSLDFFSFSMYPGGNLNETGWNVRVSGTPVGDSLEGRKLIGTIDTRGRFKSN